MNIYISRSSRKIILFLAFIYLGGLSLSGQSSNFWIPSDTINKSRLWLVAGGGGLAYTAASIGLYEIWYKQYPRSNFQFFDDWGEWENMDKWGHAMTAYTESFLAYKGARWVGFEQKSAVWIGAGVGTLLQTTVEVMDGFSERWGFSVYDFAFNTGGVGLFVSQELLWQEQRILLKVSNTRPNYSSSPITNPSNGFTASPREAAFDLFGSNYAEAFLKDYNGMTIWATVTPYSFLSPQQKEQTWVPAWLGVSLGIGAEGIYGAYGNVWTAPSGDRLPLLDIERYKQYYLSLDIDTGRIRTKSPFLKTVFSVIRWIKIPAPTLEWNTKGQLIFHPIYW